jgi:hypothetical protein
MKRRLFIGVLATVGIVLAQDAKEVLVGNKLTEGFDMGLNTDKNQTDWLKDEESGFRLSYPARQKWGAVFITVGPPVDPPRPGLDLSRYKYLVLEMRGGVGGEKVYVGIKSNAQPDNGSEVKVEETLGSEWQTYRYPLARFVRADSARLYVVAELVFSGGEAATVYVRSVRYSVK